VAAEKKGTTIVIKKIYNSAGHHGGSWKVALADFMTALMCFFLVMWLLAQSSETKKAVSDYFSTPSIIEYNFSTSGWKSLWRNCSWI
jgi:chemotaxis protein MotB